jgi:hypothetical protein
MNICILLENIVCCSERLLRVVLAQESTASARFWRRLILRHIYRTFQKELYNFKLIQMYSEDMYSVLNCHNVAEHTEFYLG